MPLPPLPPLASWRIPLGVALASLAVIAFQLVIMQQLSIAQWHHFAYMVISMAMLGFGAAGTLLALAREALSRHYRLLLPLLYLASGATLAAAAWLAGQMGSFDLFLLFFERQQLLLLLVSYLIYALPFFFAGLAITLAFYCERQRIGLLYFANLVGSGAGALLIVLLLWWLPLALLPGVLALFLVAAAWLSYPPRWPLHLASLATLGIIAASLLLPQPPQPSEYKAISAALQLPDAELVHTSFSPYGQIDVVSAPVLRFAPSLSLHYRATPPVRDILFVNGEYNGTLLGAFAPHAEHPLAHSTRALPYIAQQPQRLLLLHSATGSELSLALHQGVAEIDAVEPNRHLANLLYRDHPEWIDRLYHHPAVTLHPETTRSFLARAEGRASVGYDAIILPTLGSFGGNSGVHALGEQFHLTAEAFAQMWRLLDQRGVLAVTLWHEQPPRTLPRLLASWRELLEEQGIEALDQHLVALSSWGTLTLLLSRAPLDSERVERIRHFASAQGFDPLLLPGITPERRQRYHRHDDAGLLTTIDQLLSAPLAATYRDYPLNIRPASDNRPYFFQFLEWSKLGTLYTLYGLQQLPYLELGFVLAGVTALQILLVSLLLILLPLLRLGWQRGGRRWTLLYFGATGLGYLFFEIALIQQLLLYLGNPVYSTALVLAVLLIASGIGSFLTTRLTAAPRQLLTNGLLAALLILLTTLLLLPLLAHTMGLATGYKVVIVLLLLAIPGLLLGTLFPLGLRALNPRCEAHIPWACGIDSCLSVTATALATLLALHYGLTQVMLLAAACYLLVAVAGVRLGR